MKKFYKHLVVFAVFIFMIAPAFVFVAQAQPDIGTGYVADTGLEVSTETDPRALISNIVTYLMTFLGLIAVIVILLGGFKWMTAAGNEDKVAEAKKTIIAGCIGLVIILAAYAIVNFVINITNDAVITNTL